MTVETIREPPASDAFTPLSQHQEATPASFFSGKPVLHYHTTDARIIVSKSQISSLPVLSIPDSAKTLNGHANDSESGETITIPKIDVWVTTERFILYNTSTKTGSSISYPSITLHAIQRLTPSTLATPPPTQEESGLYMQLSIGHSDACDTDDTDSILELTVIPPTDRPSIATGPNLDPGRTTPPTPAIQTFFTAVSTCSNLHPDPEYDGSEAEEDDDDPEDRIVFEGDLPPGALRGTGDGSLPPPFPGSGGWITAANVGEYFDAEGNWIGGGREAEEGLGEGAGTVRPRGEEFNTEVEEERGDGKWQRTE